MDCAQYREALSARLDGESLGMSDGDLDRHVAGCTGCAAWSVAVTRATRLVRLAPAPAVPDLSAQILGDAGLAVAATGAPAAAGHPEPGRTVGPVAVARLGGPTGSGRMARLRAIAWSRARWVGALRVALAVVGVAQAAIGWPALALGMDTMQAPEHVAHESGAWNLALAVALLVIARRPRYAPGLLPLLGAFVAVLTIVTLPDVVAGYVPMTRLAGHLLFVGALALVALLSREVRRGETPPLDERGSGAGRKSVGDRDAAARMPVEQYRRPALGDSHHRVPMGEVTSGDAAGDLPNRRKVVA
jgi:predicted anti-sigma-YlaC factor YlaD